MGDFDEPQANDCQSKWMNEVEDKEEILRTIRMDDIMETKA